MAAPDQPESRPLNNQSLFMASSKLKIAAVGTAAVVVAAGVVFLGFKAVHWIRLANAPDIQGAWAGKFSAGQTKMPLMYKFSRVKGAYQAVGVDIYQGVREIPVSKLVYDYPKIHIEQKVNGFTFDGTLNPKTMEMSGRWKQGKGSGPFVLKLSDLADAFPEPMAESEYTPRSDSALQGYWTGTLKPDNRTIRVAIKIADRGDGTFRVAGDSPDQGAKDVEATAVTWHTPTVRIEFGGIGGYFEGTVDASARVITGKWMSGGKPLPLVLERAKPGSVAGLDPASEAQKDYSHAGPNDLPGHWQGTLEVKKPNVKLRLLLNVAKLPDGKFSATMVSVDQGSGEIPASLVEYDAPDTHLEWSGIGGSFRGKLENGKITGIWQQNKSELPLVFERVPAS